MNNEEIIGIVSKTVKEILASSSEKAFMPEPKMTLNIAKALSYAVEEKAKEILLEKEIGIIVSLGDGEASATAWGCDLTYDYVKINGDYRT